MKITNPILFGFIPDENSHPVLRHDKGLIIWAAIKCNHIVDQYFDDSCLKLAKLVDEEPPLNAAALRSYALKCHLNIYGTKEAPHEGYSYVCTIVADMEFWQDLFDALTGQLKLIIKFPAEKGAKL